MNPQNLIVLDQVVEINDCLRVSYKDFMLGAFYSYRDSQRKEKIGYHEAAPES